MKRFLFAVFGLAIVAVSSGAGAWIAYRELLLRAMPFSAPVEIEVRPGDSLRVVARRLEEAALVPSADALVLWARWKGIDREVRRGRYAIAEPLTPIQILERLVEGKSILTRVTVREGLTIEETAAVLAEAGLGDAGTISELARDEEFARELVGEGTLEGYLFPDTYAFDPEEREARILRAMVSGFFHVFDEAMERRAAEAGFERREVVILASIIEKETGSPEERPLIAAVFRNRLRLGMPLQSDPTVIYGLEDFDGNLTRKHLETPTHYNTYTIPGLPPGPIASPGRGSLEGVLDPAESEALYFVSRNDGTHEFSNSLQAHNRAVDRFQRRRQRP